MAIILSLKVCMILTRRSTTRMLTWGMHRALANKLKMTFEADLEVPR